MYRRDSYYTLPLFCVVEGVTIERTKYNVDKNTEKRTCDGIVFDSVMEMRYYRDVVLPGLESGSIKEVALQPAYELQPKFTYNGKSVRPITYVADFWIRFEDGREEVIDVKGMADSLAKCKRKMFLYRFPNVEYRWITYVKKYGGWNDWDEVNRLRRLEKLKRKKGGCEDGIKEKDND